MSNEAMGGMVISLFFGFIAFLIMAYITRWIFRINSIHARLEENGVLLSETVKRLDNVIELMGERQQ